MTPKETLDELERLEAAATPGDWQVYCDLNLRAPDPRGGTLCPLTNSWLDEQRKANYAFIVAARNHVKKLLADSRQLAAVLAKVKERHDEIPEYKWAASQLLKIIEGE